MTEPPSRSLTELYRRVFDTFTAPISRFDCGQKCAPHNGGKPYCCSTKNAVPILDQDEYALLRSRSDLWHEFTPINAPGRKLVAALPRSCLGAECKGAEFCERENRSLSCRSFPFVPYVTKERLVPGLTYHWGFEHFCWVINHLEVATLEFVRECLAAYEAIYAEDPSEFEGHFDNSAAMRRQFTRWNRLIPLIGRDGSYLVVEPRTHVIRPAQRGEYHRHGPYQNDPTEAPAAAPVNGTVT
jgi:hypothetical protein